MLIAGALPLAAHPDPRRVGVIGWGSGLTTHTVLGSRVPQRVDTIEIEPAMWEGAKTFLPRNARAYQDPRSAVHFDDARKYLATHGNIYDVLISEPSNPWVSGVSSLFTREFYALARRQLQPDGLLVQWVQNYEMSDSLLAEMLAALLAEFPHSEVFQANSGDLVVLAHKGAAWPLHGAPWREPELADELRRVGLGSEHELAMRRLAGPRALAEFVRQLGVRPHSDYWPTVALAGPEHRFRGSVAARLSMLVVGGLPVLNVLDCREPSAGRAPPEQPYIDLLGKQSQVARLLPAAVLEGQRPATLLGLAPDLVARVDALLAQRSGIVPLAEPLALQLLDDLATATLGPLDAPSLQRLWSTEWWLDAPWRPGAAVQAQLRLYAAMSRHQWVAAHDAARSLLEQPQTPVSEGVRDSTIVLGLLAAAASGDAARFAAWQRDFAAGIVSRPWRDSAAFVAGWVGHERVCAAAPR